VTSPALSLAIAAYQRDQGLASTGALDGTVVQRLSAAAQ
jgi:localization factor PodJL